MYALINRRTPNPERQEETRERAATEFFPRMRQAPGFIAFYLIAGEDGQNTAISLWDDRVSAEAWMPHAEAWSETLDELGNRLESRTKGEVTTHVTPQK
jgi:heme-degrading monooxygenase HmoA